MNPLQTQIRCGGLGSGDIQDEDWGHIRTVRDEHVATPNELVRRRDGRELWASNGHSVKVVVVSNPLDTVGNLCDWPIAWPVPYPQATGPFAFDRDWNYLLPH